MGIVKQPSMLPDMVPDAVLGDVRDKILELYRNQPEVAGDDKILILAFWESYDNLERVLGDKYAAFTRWFLLEATKTESIRRSRQSLTEHELIRPPENTEHGREYLEKVWHRYWGACR